MSKNSKKARARKAREKRANEEERLRTGDTTANRRAVQEAAARSKRRGRASNAYAGVAGNGAATVGQMRLYSLMNLFSVVGALTLIAAIGLAFCSLSDDWSAAVLTFLGYGGIDSDLGSPGTLAMAESAFALVLSIFYLLCASQGKAWLRGQATFRRFITIAEIAGGLAICWMVTCFFLAHLIEPISSISVVLFLVMMSVIMRLHRERPHE
ncbi:MAG: hypothetical protein ACOX1O_01105 [Eggerthellaceae bacterium]|jgi:hypothetical protein